MFHFFFFKIGSLLLQFSRSSEASLLASGSETNGGRAACYRCSCCCCSCWTSSRRSSAGTTASISSAQVKIMRLLRHPRRPLRPPSALRPRVLLGLLEQYDNVLHVSWEMGVERYVEEVEMEAGKLADDDLSRLDDAAHLFSTPTKPTPLESFDHKKTAATAPSRGSSGWTRTSSSCPR